ncbi:MAG: hypothetical protein A2063_06555 [Gallionellales bacterium GWA2_60_142]|nr:MAG: hypothetical protein A2063_06555 [Gallionellales bacterium GWA2_60_142]
MQTVVNRVLQYIRDLIENFLRGRGIGNNYPKIAAVSGHQIGFAKGIPQSIRYGNELLERFLCTVCFADFIPVSMSNMHQAKLYWAGITMHHRHDPFKGMDEICLGFDIFANHDLEAFLLYGRRGPI